MNPSPRRLAIGVFFFIGAIGAIGALAPLVGGCAAIQETFGNREPDPAWQEARIHSPSDRVLWKLSLLSLERMGFPMSGGLDPASGRIESGWQTHLAPFSRQGYRLRAEVEMTPIEPAFWRVRARVARQSNEALVAPLDPARAEWKWAADDVEQAQILLQHISSLLATDLETTEQEDPLEALMRSVEESRP